MPTLHRAICLNVRNFCNPPQSAVGPAATRPQSAVRPAERSTTAWSGRNVKCAGPRMGSELVLDAPNRDVGFTNRG
eukprot:4592390-Alexandrium_andersonii.AAC.1